MDEIVTDLHDGYAYLALIEVAGTSPKQSGPKTGRTKNPSPPAPANLNVLVLRDPATKWETGNRINGGNLPSVPAVLAEWLVQLRDGLGLTERYTVVRGGVEVVLDRPRTLPTYPIAQLGMLRRHHDWITGQEWLPDYVAELTELRTAINTTLVDKPIIRTLGACYLLVGESPCTGRLVQDNGSDIVRCTGCRARWVTAQQLAHLEASLSSRRSA